MAIDALRGTEILTSADALLPNQSDTSTIPAALSIASLPSELGLSGTDTYSDPVETVANNAILDLHAQLEGLADSNGLLGSVHGLTNLGETVGLGHLGSANLLTTALGAPTALAGGNTAPAGQVLPETTAIEGTAAQLVGGTANDAGINPGVAAPITNLTSEASALSTAPLTTFANDTVDSLHATLEGAADPNGLIGSVHGLTNLGETVGLGRIGDANLVTDVVDTPAALLAGDTSTLTHLPTDVGNVASAAQGLVSGIASDLASGALLADPVGNAVGFVTDLASLPVAGIANDAINSLHATLEVGLDPLALNTIHGITSLGNTVGLGELGGSNLLTDALSAPGAALSGDTTPLSHLPSDLGSIGSAVAALPGDVAADLGSNGLIDTLTHPTTGGGVLAGDLPGSGVVDTVTTTATSLVDNATSAAGLGNVGQAVTSALDTTQGGLVHDVAQIPGNVVAGATTGLPPVVGDVGATLTSVGSTVAAAATDATHALSVTDAGGDVAPLVDTVAGVTAPLTSALGSGSLDTATHTVDSAVGAVTAPLTSGTGGLDTATHTVDSAVGAVTAPLTSGTGGLDTATHVVDSAVGAVTAPLASGTGGLDTATSTVDSAVGAVTAPLTSGSEGLDTATHAISAVTAPLTSGSGGVASTVGGLVGDSIGTSGHDLATVSLGPQTPTSGANLDILSNESGTTQLIDSHVGTANAPTPILASVAILPDSIHVPTATGGGLDALSGVVSSVAPTAAPVTGAASAATGLDLGIAHVDVPVAAHAEPLHALAHAA